MKTRLSSLLTVIVLPALLILSSRGISFAQHSLFGVQIRASSPDPQPRWQLFNYINDDSTVANPLNTLYNDGSGVYDATDYPG